MKTIIDHSVVHVGLMTDSTCLVIYRNVIFKA